MTTMAQHPAGVDAAADSSKKLGTGMSIAELRSKFQKEGVLVGGMCPKQLPRNLQLLKKRDADSSVAGADANDDVIVHTLPTLQPEIVREMQQKFSVQSTGMMPLLPKKVKQITNGCATSPSNTFGARDIIAKDTKAKPVPPAKCGAALVDSCHSPYKVPKCPPKPTFKCVNTHEAKSIVEKREEVVTMSVSSSLVEASVASKLNVKPNPSHLSSLISEIHQQQLEEQLQKNQYTQNANGETESSKRPLQSKASPLPPLPQVPASSPASVGHHRTYSAVDLGPPPPIPAPNIPSSVGVTTATSTTSSSATKWKRKALPSLTELGSPPVKPSKPPSVQQQVSKSSTPPLPVRNFPQSSLSVPPRPSKPVPSPPSTLPHIEMQQLVTKLATDRTTVLPALPVRTFIEEEDSGGVDDFYDDTEPHRALSLLSNNTTQSSGGSISHASHQEELYQDAFGVQLSEVLDDDVYEDIRISETASDTSSVSYGSKKGDDRLRRDEERRLKREQKEREKKLKETEKIWKRFNLTGKEVPVETGIVKESTKGRRRDDLVVKGGERVAILRIGDNPVGKWLARSFDGKLGYVDLTNIEVDASSIKYVMSQSRVRLPSPTDMDSSGELYNDVESGEAIYEEFS